MLQEQLIREVGELNDDAVFELICQLIEEGNSPNQIQSYVGAGMKLVGDHYEAGDYFMADLIFAGLMYEKILRLPQMKRNIVISEGILGRVLIGTPLGDLHEIGKGIIVQTLSSNGFEVIDLGSDLSASAYADAVMQVQPDIIAISSILTSSMDEIKKLNELLKSEGKRDSLKMIVGGNNTFSQHYEQLGADAYGRDAMEGLEICLSLIRGK